MKSLKALCAAVLFAATGTAFATPFTMLSPTGVNVNGVGATKVGGIVVDLFGTNGAHVISQVAANTLAIGYSSTAEFIIGTQTGYNATVLAALGGGLQSAAFRFTLWDGDTAAGNFDFNQNSLLTNNLVFGNWSTVATQQTSADGNTNISSGTGFRDNLLDTGWFYSNNATLMSSLFTSLQSTNQLVFKMRDTTANDNDRDFRQGVSASLINVGAAPSVASVPEPGSLALLGLSLLALGAARRKPKQK